MFPYKVQALRYRYRTGLVFSQYNICVVNSAGDTAC